jgi:hypothetical protein
MVLAWSSPLCVEKLDFIDLGVNSLVNIRSVGASFHWLCRSIGLLRIKTAERHDLLAGRAKSMDMQITLMNDNASIVAKRNIFACIGLLG